MQRLSVQGSECKHRESKGRESKGRESKGMREMTGGRWQVKVLKEMRQASNESSEMNESFAATVQGIAAGMGWTG